VSAIGSTGWAGRSVSSLPIGTPTYQRHELENDLIGGYYALSNAAPTFQFANVHRSRAEVTQYLI
jgi:hypothetical protein